MTKEKKKMGRKPSAPGTVRIKVHKKGIQARLSPDLVIGEYFSLESWDEKEKHLLLRKTEDASNGVTRGVARSFKVYYTNAFAKSAHLSVGTILEAAGVDCKNIDGVYEGVATPNKLLIKLGTRLHTNNGHKKRGRK